MAAGIPTTAGVNKTPLHPETIDLLRREEELGLPPFYELSVGDARVMEERSCQEYAGKTDFNGRIWDTKVSNQSVEGGIPIKVYQPQSDRTDPAILMYFHGGGQVLGSIACYDTFCRMLAQLCDVIIVSVEYRLAPEHKLPAGLEDCDAATRWVMQNRTTVGGSEKSQVGVGGDSAGGQSAAMACHYVQGISFQIIIYGRLDERSRFDSYKEYRDGPGLDKKGLDWFQSHRLPDLGPSRTNPRFSALQQTRFDHIPPTIFIVAECDSFRDEQYEYARVLKEAGVHSEVHMVKGTLHGFINLPGIYVECCREAYSKIASFVRRIVYKEKKIIASPLKWQMIK